MPWKTVPVCETVAIEHGSFITAFICLNMGLSKADDPLSNFRQTGST